MQRSKYEVDMCHGPLLKKILVYSMPLILTGILQLVYNAADIVVVGRYAGSTALAAVGSTTSLINLIVNLFMNLSIGVSVAVAHNYGAKNFTAVSETVHTAFSLSLVIGAVVGAYGFFASRFMLELMGSPANVLEQSALYLRIFFLSIPATMVFNFGASILRAVGNTRQPLYYLAVSGVINVVLNLVLVIRFHMGVAGVAIATVFAQYVSAAFITICLMRTEGCLQLHLNQLGFHGDKVRAIFRIGFPAGLQSLVFSISNVLIQSSINSFGSVAMAGSAASSNLEGFIYTAMNAVSQAALTFTGQNVGGRQYTRIRKVVRICLAVVLAVGLGMGALFWLFNSPLLRVYLPSDPQAVLLGTQRLFIITSLYFFMGFIDVLVGSMRGMGTSLAPMIVVLVGACGLRILWIYTAFAAHRTLEVLYMAYPASWVVTFLIELVFYFLVYRKLVRQSRKTEDGTGSSQN
ncbi:MAG: MATE family efflux transporter [Clostridia bacterium]|nr:MATE family efflux transporter [Candidatus Pelethousia sp.]NCB30708.1 MATE family efflux transporter [Clostridia bacterium]